MTSRELFESEYLINDVNYLKYYCVDSAEAYELEKEMSYDEDTWLFNKPSDGLEDRYDEESMP